MQDQLIAVYEAMTFTDAQMLSDHLSEAGIEAYFSQTDSPVQGLIASNAARVVWVRKVDRAEAMTVVRQFAADGHAPLPHDRDDAPEESPAWAADALLDDDSPSSDIEGEGVERLDRERAGPESVEVEGLQRDAAAGGPATDHSRIARFGADRDVEVPADTQLDDEEEESAA